MTKQWIVCNKITVKYTDINANMKQKWTNIQCK